MYIQKWWVSPPESLLQREFICPPLSEEIHRGSAGEGLEKAGAE